MPSIPITINGNDPQFTGSFQVPQPTTALPPATTGRAWSTSGITAINVLATQNQTTSSTPFVGDILDSQVVLDFDDTNDDYLQPISETPTQNFGMLVAASNGFLGVPSDIKVFDRTLEEDVSELLPPLPASPPFSVPVLRPKVGSTSPIGIKWYNTLDNNFGRLQRFDDVMAVEQSNVLFLADVYNYKDEDGREVDEGLAYIWRVDGNIVSNERYLYLPNVKRLDTEAFSEARYIITLEVRNVIGSVVNSVNLRIWGGEENNTLIDLDPSVPFQLAYGYYWFWDATQNRIVQVANDGTVVDINGNPLDIVIDPTNGQVPTTPPTVKFTTNSGDTYEYNVDSENIKGILRRTRYIEVLPRTMVGIWGRKDFAGGNYFFFNYSSDSIYRIELPASKRDVRSVKIRYFNDFNNYLNLQTTKNVSWPTSITRRKFDIADMLHWLGASPTDAELVTDLKRFT